MKKEEYKEKKYKNGQLVVQPVGICENCRRGFGSSMFRARMKYLDGHLYCLDCYPQMVDVYLADKRFSFVEKNEKIKERHKKEKEKFLAQQRKELSQLLGGQKNEKQTKDNR